MVRSKKLPLPVRTLLVNAAGAVAGAGVGFVSCPATGELGDAFRPFLITAAAIGALVLSGIVTAWLAAANAIDDPGILRSRCCAAPEPR
jgi:hypothetical protein